MNEPVFILASASPRRQELLQKAGYRFEVIPSDVDEEAYGKDGIDSVALCKQLALAKAKDVAARYADRFVLGADTVVDADGHIIGKPTDAADAERITRKLFSRPHKVITGIALVCLSRRIEVVQADISSIYPRRLTEAQIADHIASGNWQGKAGAYGIQETGDAFIERTEGSFTNVMGLPMEQTEALLQRYGLKPDLGIGS